MKNIFLLLIFISSYLFCGDNTKLENIELKTVCVSDITISNSNQTKFLNVLLCLGVDEIYPDQIVKKLILTNISSLKIGEIKGSDGFNLLKENIQKSKPKDMKYADIVKLTFYDSEKFIGNYVE